MEKERLEITIWDVFRYAVKVHPRSQAITYGTQTLTFEGLHQRTDRIAAYLYQEGIRPGDPVAICMDTDLDSMCMYYGIWKAGAVAVPLNPKQPVESLDYMLRLTSPRLTFYEMPREVDMAPILPKETETIFRQMRRSVDSQATATLIFTSGTTSQPKAVPMTQGGMLNSAISLGARLQVTEKDRFCGVLPIFHSFCISVNMLIPLLYGACTCIARDKHTYTLLSLIQKERCTILNGVPAMFHAMIKKKDLGSYDVSSLRAGFIGGAFCPPGRSMAIEERLDLTLLSTLGQTECTGGFTAASLEDSAELRSRSVGKALDGMEVSIQSPEGQCLESGRTGEICVRGYLVMSGYWKDEEKSREVLKDGWLHTGDLGRMDGEGYLYILGRIKQIIIRAGENISPAEIETVILKESAVGGCKVIGIPEEHYGEEICACILPAARGTLDLPALRERLEQELPGYKVPRYMLLFDGFPQNDIGKVKIEELKKRAIERIGGKKMSGVKRPLEGIRVVELSTFIAAATTGRFFANMGADVIKLESGKGDPERNGAVGEGINPDPLENTTWEQENGNKRGLALDLKSPRGREAFFKLLGTADIFITNTRPAALQRMGIGYEDLKDRFPKLVYGLVTGYGEYGPAKDVPGFDLTAFFSRGGYVDAMRQKDGIPFNMVPGLGDHNVGLNLAAGLLAALFQAQRTGKGDKVECSLYETSVFNMSMNIAAAQYPQFGMHYPINIHESQNPCNGAFRTKDDRFIQMCFPQYNLYFRSFITALGRGDLVTDAYYPQENMIKNRLSTELYNAITDAFRTKTVEEWEKILTEADVPFAKCFSLEEILEDEQAWANGCLYKTTFRNGNERILVDQPVRIRSMGDYDHRRAPDIGEHTPDILAEIGYSQEEIQGFLQDGVAFQILKATED